MLMAGGGHPAATKKLLPSPPAARTNDCQFPGRGKQPGSTTCEVGSNRGGKKFSRPPADGRKAGGKAYWETTRGAAGNRIQQPSRPRLRFSRSGSRLPAWPEPGSRRRGPRRQVRNRAAAANGPQPPRRGTPNRNAAVQLSFPNTLPETSKLIITAPGIARSDPHYIQLPAPKGGRLTTMTRPHDYRVAASFEPLNPVMAVVHPLRLPCKQGMHTGMKGTAIGKGVGSKKIHLSRVPQGRRSQVFRARKTGCSTAPACRSAPPARSWPADNRWPRSSTPEPSG